MKYRLEGTTLEMAGKRAKITLGNGKSELTQKNPSALDIMFALERLQGYPANTAQRQACSRLAWNIEVDQEQD